MSSCILLDEKQKFFRKWNQQPHDTHYHTATVPPDRTDFFLIYILYALYDSHEQENDVTKEIRGNQINAIKQTPYSGFNTDLSTPASVDDQI